MNAYETVIIIDPATDDAGIERAIEKVSGTIASHSGEIVNVARWGKRKMSYRINNRQEGYYVCLQFNSPSAAPKELDRMLRLDESVIRHLIIRGHIQENAPAPAVEALAPDAAVKKEAAAVWLPPII
ncbi:MAG: 30S ribosomal protein S6 [Candidatus Edwardsbacteria bacterium]|nr:30S ribosomal protein S6 [Candidatus Edwardsbacteria bacterium]